MFDQLKLEVKTTGEYWLADCNNWMFHAARDAVAKVRLLSISSELMS